MIFLRGGRVRLQLSESDAKNVLTDRKGKLFGYLLWVPSMKQALELQSGRVVTTTERRVKKSNKVYDEALIKRMNGLKVGGRCSFYYDPAAGKVTTFCGRTVSEQVRHKGRVVTFQSDGKTFRGYTRTGHLLLDFRRVK